MKIERRCFNIDEPSIVPPRRQSNAQQGAPGYLWNSTTQELIPILPEDHPDYRAKCRNHQGSIPPLGKRDIKMSDQLQTPKTARLPRSSAAERMRAHRQRRRDGLRCLTIELRETEIDALARNGFLKADARNDLDAIRDALYGHLERTFDAMP